MREKVFSVSSLNKYIKSIFDTNDDLRSILVEGEISNFKNHVSGHWYFSLKDDKGVIKGVMFRTNTAKVTFVPKNGMKVLIAGYVTVFERDGAYQLYAEDMLPSGLGTLHLQYEALKEKLTHEGLFDVDKKRSLPTYARKVGIVTAKTGAAVQDMISIIRRRDPSVEIYLVPAIVQGKEGAKSIVDGLEVLYQSDVDVIITGRGGGSLEDLWCFNEEIVVRKVSKSPVPIISAVGHETDFTLCDFAADVRAATPSMAAELAVAVRKDMKAQAEQKGVLLNAYYKRLLQEKQRELQFFIKNSLLENPSRLLDGFSERVDRDYENLQLLMRKLIEQKERAFKQNMLRLDDLSPLKVLERGYSVCEKDHQAVMDASTVASGDKLRVILAKGEILCQAQEIVEG